MVVCAVPLSQVNELSVLGSLVSLNLCYQISLCVPHTARCRLAVGNRRQLPKSTSFRWENQYANVSRTGIVHDGRR
mgnify:CR=1 FL=1